MISLVFAQFAFQKNHSTLTCLHHVVGNWLEAINESEIVDIVFLIFKNVLIQ